MKIRVFIQSQHLILTCYWYIFMQTCVWEHQVLQLTSSYREMYHLNVIFLRLWVWTTSIRAFLGVITHKHRSPLPLLGVIRLRVATRYHHHHHHLQLTLFFFFFFSQKCRCEQNVNYPLYKVNVIWKHWESIRRLNGS